MRIEGRINNNSLAAGPLTFMSFAYQSLRYAKYRLDLVRDHISGYGASSIAALKQARSPGVLSIHRKDAENIGDVMSSPFRYFRQANPVYELDLAQLKTISPLLLRRNEPLILGGGGLFYFHHALNRLLLHYKGPLIGWGIGRNGPLSGARDRIHKEAFALLGLRDWPTHYEWVPCVSCLSPLFEIYRGTSPLHDFVLYDHRNAQLPIHGHPRLSNACMDMAHVLEFLASGETVITNSYHGAYWGVLLRRRVVILPFSDRLLHMRFPAIVGTKDDYRQRSQEMQIEPFALEICRKANLDFAKRVEELTQTDLHLIDKVAEETDFRAPFPHSLHLWGLEQSRDEQNGAGRT